MRVGKSVLPRRWQGIRPIDGSVSFSNHRSAANEDLAVHDLFIRYRLWMIYPRELIVHEIAYDLLNEASKWRNGQYRGGLSVSVRINQVTGEEISFWKAFRLH